MPQRRGRPASNAPQRQTPSSQDIQTLFQTAVVPSTTVLSMSEGSPLTHSRANGGLEASPGLELMLSPDTREPPPQPTSCNTPSEASLNLLTKSGASEQRREELDLPAGELGASMGTSTSITTMVGDTAILNREITMEKEVNMETPGNDRSSAAQGTGSLICFTEGLGQDTFKIVRNCILFLLNKNCKEYLRPLKKSLRKLDLPEELPKEKKLKYTKKSLIRLGDHINAFLQNYCKPGEVKHWRKMMWRFVSLFSELDGKRLHKLYMYTKNNQMDKFLMTYYASETLDSIFLPGSTDLMQLYRAWGLHGDISDMTEKLSKVHSSSQMDLQSEQEEEANCNSYNHSDGCEASSEGSRSREKRNADVLQSCCSQSLGTSPEFHCSGCQDTDLCKQ
ncbi:CHD1 helical C-terminal domain containing protein 1 [Microcaecilia unicolor]|uniref:Uncharacterized protein C17orf64 homolog n=1 Tax=Microcaecilia unicolor TaxID=1415580 RepID=A0A6P7ZVB3_9AMPH|nr:uncharacterized protein C17orf64 homolog [Microcaecilia unicolor]